MRNLPFVLWAICWPLVYSLGMYIDHLIGNRYPADTIAVVALMHTAIWIAIGYLVYESKPEKGDSIVIKLP